MSVNSVRVLQSQISQNARNAAILRGGSVVQARVLSKNADGSYMLSLAGQKISVKSESPLQIGGTFSARVILKGESVHLSLLKENSEVGEFVQKFTYDGKSLPSQFLSSLGFEPNEESLKIFQFMQQLGMKIDVPLAKKTLRSSKNRMNTDDEKIQISFLLEEKGIKSTDERVDAILGENPRDSRQSDSNRQGQNDDFAAMKKNAPHRINPSDIKAFFDSVDAASLTRKNGLLSAFNTVLASQKKEIPLRHWIVLPFEWVFQNSFGNIKLLFDSNLKKLQKLVIDIKNASQNRIFALDFKNNLLDSVKFADSVPAPSDETSLLSSLFGPSVRVESVPFASLCGFPCYDEAFSFVQGEA